MVIFFGEGEDLETTLLIWFGKEYKSLVLIDRNRFARIGRFFFFFLPLRRIFYETRGHSLVQRRILNTISVRLSHPLIEQLKILNPI